MERYNNNVNRARSFNHPRKHPPPMVEDLRDKLNRMRLERGETSDPEGSHTKNLPPPDPHYNFLRDRLRGDQVEPPPHQKRASFRGERKSAGAPENLKNPDEQKLLESENKTNLNENHSQQEKKKKQHPEIQIWQRRPEKIHKDENRPYNKSPNAGKSNNKPPPSKESSVNIKVEFSSTTGERKCLVDGTKTVQVPKNQDSFIKPRKKFQRQNFSKNKHNTDDQNNIATQDNKTSKFERRQNKKDRQIEKTPINKINEPLKQEEKLTELKPTEPDQHKGQENKPAILEHSDERKEELNPKN